MLVEHVIESIQSIMQFIFTLYVVVYVMIGFFLYFYGIIIIVYNFEHYTCISRMKFVLILTSSLIY